MQSPPTDDLVSQLLKHDDVICQQAAHTIKMLSHLLAQRVDLAAVDADAATAAAARKFVAEHPDTPKPVWTPQRRSNITLAQMMGAEPYPERLDEPQGKVGTPP